MGMADVLPADPDLVEGVLGSKTLRRAQHSFFLPYVLLKALGMTWFPETAAWV